MGDLGERYSGTVNLICTSNEKELFSRSEYPYVAQKKKPKTYVFIQTDKPIYKGGDIIKFRVLTTDEQFMPKQTSLKVQIKVKHSKIFCQILVNWCNDSIRMERITSSHNFLTHQIPEVRVYLEPSN